MEFDIVMNVATHHNEIAHIAIKYLMKNASPRRLYIITRSDNLCNFKELSGSCDVSLIDGETLIPGVNYSSLGKYLSDRSANPDQAGWYFQQFRKMEACFIPGISGHYLIWDADTILLEQISFFNTEGGVFIHPEKEYHKAYFDTYEKILGIKRSADYSFISQHLMVNTEYMRELIDAINSHVKSEKHWVWKIMDSIATDDLSNKGFSEFETYGNFVLNRHPESFDLRSLRYFRFGAGKFGMRPNKYDLHYLSSTYTYASFETWNHGNKFKILGRKIRSFLVFIKTYSFNR